MEPWKAAVPKLNMPPSAATNQYPLPPEVDDIPTMGWFRRAEELVGCGVEKLTVTDPVTGTLSEVSTAVRVTDSAT